MVPTRESSIVVKPIRVDEAEPSLRYISNLVTSTQPGQYSLTTNNDRSQAITLHVNNTSGTNNTGILLVKPHEVRYDMELTLQAYRLSCINGTTTNAAVVPTVTTLYCSKTTCEYPEGTVNTTTAYLAACVDARTRPMTRRAPGDATTEASAAIYQQPGFLANDTRFAPFKSITIAFNNNSTILRIVDPDLNLSLANALYGRRTNMSDACGEFTTCTPQFRRNDPNFTRVEYNPDAAAADAYKHFRIMEECCPAYGDPRRYACGAWFEGLKLGDKTHISLFLADMFPAFAKKELMYMPAHLITFELNNLFRELFVTVIPPVLSTLAADGAVVVTFPQETLPPNILNVDNANDGQGNLDETYSYSAGTIVRSTMDAIGATDAFYTINKCIFAITDVRYRAEVYATPLIMVPRRFTSAFTDHEIFIHKIANTDRQQRVTFKVSRDPIAAIIMFKARDTEYYASADNETTITSADANHYFNKRWWPNNRQISRVVVTKDGIDQAGVDNDYLQWVATAARRENRRRLVRDARTLSGYNERGYENMFGFDEDEFIRTPYFVVRLDDAIRNPGTYGSALTENRATSSEYALTIDFDFIRDSSTNADPELSSNLVISPNMQLHDLQIVLQYEHTFVSEVNTVVCTKKN